MIKKLKNKVMDIIGAYFVPNSWNTLPDPTPQENWEQGIIKSQPDRIKKALREDYKPSDILSDISILFVGSMSSALARSDRLLSKGAALDKSQESRALQILGILLRPELDDNLDLMRPYLTQTSAADHIIHSTDVPDVAALVILEAIKQNMERKGLVYTPNMDNIFKMLGSNNDKEHPAYKNREKHMNTIEAVHKNVQRRLAEGKTNTVKNIKKRARDSDMDLSYWTDDFKRPHLENLPSLSDLDTRTGREMFNEKMQEIYKGYDEEMETLSPDMVSLLEKFKEMTADSPPPDPTQEDMDAFFASLEEEEESDQGMLLPESPESEENDSSKPTLEDISGGKTDAEIASELTRMVRAHQKRNGTGPIL